MPGPYTWADMTFLTAQERSGLQQLATFGQQVVAAGANGATEPVTGVVPSATLSNAKAAEKIRRQLMDLWGPAIIGTQYTAMYHRYQNQQNFEDTNP